MKNRPALKIVLIAILLTTFFSEPLLAAGSETHALQDAATCEQVTLHYRRREADYDGWGLHVWGPTAETVTWQEPLEPAGEDDYGLFWVVNMLEGADTLNYIVHKGDSKDPGPDQTLDLIATGCEIWLTQGRETQFLDPQAAVEAMTPVIAESPTAGENQVILHYRRVAGDYDGWGLHVWGPTAEEGVTWASPLLPAGQDEYGLYWVVEMQARHGDLSTSSVTIRDFPESLTL